MIALATTLMLVGSATDLRPEAWVVISQRSSVAKGTALDVARQVSAALSEAGVPTPTLADDLTSCGGKVPCLVSAARARGVSVLVTLEVGAALDDLIVRAAAISIDENGRVMQRAEAEGSPATIAASVREKVASLFAPTIRTLLALPDPTAKKEPPPPEPAPKEPEPVRVVEATPVETPKPAEPAPAAAVSTTQGGGMGTMRLVGLGVAGVGAVMLISGVAASAVGASKRAQRDTLCPAGTQCNDPMAYELDASMRSAQTAGGVLVGLGLVFAAGGVVAFMLGGDSGGSATPAPEKKGEEERMGLAPWVGPGQAGVAVSGRF